VTDFSPDRLFGAFKSLWTPEQIFNRFCRALERELLTKTSKHDEVRKVLGIVEEVMHVAPVFYAGVDEVLRIAQYCGANPQDMDLEPVPVLPFDETILVNPHYACLLFDAETPDDDRVRRLSTPEGGLAEPAWPVVPRLGTCRWRAKFIAYQQELEGWALSTSSVYMFDHDQETMARCLVVQNATMAISKTPDGDADLHTTLRELRSGFESDVNYADQLQNCIIQTLSMALDQCRYIDLPRHHLVVEEPKRFKHTDRSPKLPRAHDRPRVRLVEPEAVRKIYPSHGGEGDGTRTVTPHVRRGHTKILTHPRYKEAKGRRVVIRPTWVGDPEWEHQGTRYRVVFRKPEEPTKGNR
jgi:hypothetical protein